MRRTLGCPVFLGLALAVSPTPATAQADPPDDPALLEDPRMPGVPFEELQLEVAAARRPWKRSDRPRRAGVSSFGFSGTNAHVILEEAPEAPRKSEAGVAPHEPILTLSATNDAALKALAERWADYLAGADGADVADICYTSNVGRTHFDRRLAASGTSLEEIRNGVTAFLEGKSADGQKFQITKLTVI